MRSTPRSCTGNTSARRAQLGSSGSIVGVSGPTGSSQARQGPVTVTLLLIRVQLIQGANLNGQDGGSGSKGLSGGGVSSQGGAHLLVIGQLHPGGNLLTQNVFEGTLEIASVGEAILGPLRQRLQNHRIQLGADLWADVAGRYGGVLHMLACHRHSGFCLEGRLAGETLVEDTAEGINVGTVVDFVAHGVFGADVLGGAEHGGGLGE